MAAPYVTHRSPQCPPQHLRSQSTPSSTSVRISSITRDPHTLCWSTGTLAGLSSSPPSTEPLAWPTSSAARLPPSAYLHHSHRMADPSLHPTPPGNCSPTGVSTIGSPLPITPTRTTGQRQASKQWNDWLRGIQALEDAYSLPSTSISIETAPAQIQRCPQPCVCTVDPSGTCSLAYPPDSDNQWTQITAYTTETRHYPTTSPSAEQDGMNTRAAFPPPSLRWPCLRPKPNGPSPNEVGQDWSGRRSHAISSVPGEDGRQRTIHHEEPPLPPPTDDRPTNTKWPITSTPPWSPPPNTHGPTHPNQSPQATWSTCNPPSHPLPPLRSTLIHPPPPTGSTLRPRCSHLSLLRWDCLLWHQCYCHSQPQTSSLNLRPSQPLPTGAHTLPWLEHRLAPIPTPRPTRRTWPGSPHPPPRQPTPLDLDEAGEKPSRSNATWTTNNYSALMAFGLGGR